MVLLMVLNPSKRSWKAKDRMLLFCNKHGEAWSSTSTSQSIAEYVDGTTPLLSEINYIYSVHPELQNKIQIHYLDEDDFSFVADYVSTFSENERQNMLISILGCEAGRKVAENTLFLIDRKRGGGMYDRIILRKLVNRLKEVCTDCAKGKLQLEN
jgi:hypothetical protein